MAKMNALQCVTQDDVCSLRIICAMARTKQYDLEELDRYGNTALLKACYLGKYEYVQVLLDFGCNVKAINYYGQNALTLATYGGHYQVIKLLLRYCTYHEFNQSSLIPALCVATLRQDRQLIQFYKSLDRKNADDLQTSHGLSASDIDGMLNINKRRNI